MTTTAVTEDAATAVLRAVAAWMGRKGYGTWLHADGTECDTVACYCNDDIPHTVGPAPFGKDAADHGLGPALRMDWDWSGTPTPTILLEGGPEDWPMRVTSGRELRAVMAEHGVWCEAYSGYALSIYPA